MPKATDNVIRFVSPDTRRNFSAGVKRSAWQRANHQCQACTCHVTGAGDIIFDHVIPWEISRDSSLGNCQVLCLTCDDLKTAQRDLPAIADARRMADFHLGIRGPGRGIRPMPCGRSSTWSKPIGALRPVERRSQAERHRELMARRGVRGW